MKTVQLPTRDMLGKALPEGVLQPSGIVTGFLYFEHVDRHADRLRLLADVVNAKNGEHVSRLAIPLVVG